MRLIKILVNKEEENPDKLIGILSKLLLILFDDNHLFSSNV